MFLKGNTLKKLYQRALIAMKKELKAPAKLPAPAPRRQNWSNLHQVT
jgi:hypothetical protein